MNGRAAPIAGSARAPRLPPPGRGRPRAARRRIGFLLATALVSAAVAYAGTRLRQPVFRAEALLRLPTPSYATSGTPRLDYGDRIMNTYANLVRLGTLDARVAKAVPATPAAELGAEVLPATELLRVTAAHPDPAVAARTADALAALLQATDAAWMGTGTNTGTAAAGGSPSSAPALELVQAATPPAAPAGPGTRTIVGLAAVLGAIGGLGLAFLRESSGAAPGPPRAATTVASVSASVSGSAGSAGSASQAARASAGGRPDAGATGGGGRASR